MIRRIFSVLVGTSVALQVSVGSVFAQSSVDPVMVNPLREAYYGDLHLHTSYSFDAYLFSSTAVGPDEAYRFAKGEVVRYLGHSVRRREPLDFLAVTDHAENIGVFNELEHPNSQVSKTDVGKALKALQKSESGSETRPDLRDTSGPIPLSDQYNALLRNFMFGGENQLPETLKHQSAAAWRRAIDFANRHYAPGRFTTFIAYEWTASPYGANLHRNVIFKGNSAPNPFTAFDSKDVEELWAWLETIRKDGFEALAIPHNGNASNGLMYNWVGSYSPLPITQAYAEARQENEPLSEIAQNKGASETHPLLSPNDEFANYEIYDFLAQRGLRRYEGRVQGSYLRDALSRGLLLQREVGTNPYKYGFVGGSDFHGGMSVSRQADYAGLNGMPVNLGGGRPTKIQAAKILNDTIEMKKTSGNLTGVWAESNTRESIYNALRRRETFATSGTKLKFRFFGGWDFDDAILHKRDWVSAAYSRGVPMGGDLPTKPAAATAPTFVVWAVKDPNSGNLDRLQVVKVWEEEGNQMEKIFDVVWSGSRKPDAETGKLPPIGDTADLKAGRLLNDTGATELKTLWRDPEFNPNCLAAYYLRVLEVPMPRWSTLLAIQNDLPLPKDVPSTVQQRGWSSPIWYGP